jgi:F-type H+-transporting ATPase subunit delta
MAEVVAQVYGLSLFEVAQEASQVKEILDELSQVCELMDQFPGFQNLLGSPVLSKEERVKLVEEDFHGQINPYLLNFLKLLAESGRMSHLKEIADEYRSLYYEQENIQEVTAVTAVAMPKELQEKLAQKLEKSSGKKILLRNQVDPSVMGGVALKVGNRQMDGTVKARLEAVGRQIAAAPLPSQEEPLQP